MTTCKMIVMALVGALSTLTTRGATHVVTSNADSGDGTLRALIGSAAAGDEIAVPEGMSIGLSTSITLTKEKNLTIVGQGAGAIVSGTTQRLFAINCSGATVETRIEMRNLTFSGVTAEHSGFMYPAGCKTENQGLELVLTGCTFRDFYATMTSKVNGAVLSHNAIGLDLYVTNCVFTANVGIKSVFGTDGDWGWFAREVELVGCTFSGNGANPPAGTPDAIRGGVMFVNAKSHFLIDNCVFSGNETVGKPVCIDQGVKATVAGGDQHNLLIRNTVFTENRCLSTDAGLFNFTSFTNEFEGCSFISNQAPYNVMGQVRSAIVRFKDCVFQENETTGENANNYSHGGLFYYCGTTGASLEFDSCAFRNNRSTTQRSILTSNTTGGALSFSRCAFEGNCCQRSQLIHANNTLASTFDSCSLVGNGPLESTTSGSDVAAIVNLGTGSKIVNCTVFSNDFRWTRCVFNTATADIYNSTIVSNVMVSGYGPVDSSSSTRCVRNCVIVGNTPRDVNTTIGVSRQNFRNNALGVGSQGIDYDLADFVEYGNLVKQTAESLKLVCPAAANDSKIKLKDGTSPLTLAIGRESPLCDAALATEYAVLDGRGYKRGKRGDAPDIGAYEFTPSGLLIIVR